MNNYLVIAVMPAEFDKVVKSLDDAMEGCSSVSVLNETLILSIESNKSILEIREKLDKAMMSDAIIVESSMDNVEVVSEDDSIIETITHPMDPNSKCKLKRKKKEKLDIDSILDKISENGWSSLSDEEMSYLNKKSS